MHPYGTPNTTAFVVARRKDQFKELSAVAINALTIDFLDNLKLGIFLIPKAAKPQFDNLQLHKDINPEWIIMIPIILRPGKALLILGLPIAPPLGAFGIKILRSEIKLTHLLPVCNARSLIDELNFENTIGFYPSAVTVTVQ
ncbi:hypothetical protein VNO78_30971 [Psophocarpus tetragonolobus]|uniref:Uncharacterized protein n=1 Tax=Psophocarpus tetragonolobus TaxID=3891 RepID=A0AAN9X6R4_PSOTE